MGSSSFIRRLPKAELHLHLEGTVTPETLVELSARNPGPPLDLAQAHALYEYIGYTGFLLAFKAVTEHLRTALKTTNWLRGACSSAWPARALLHAEVYVSVGVVYYWRRCEFEPLFIGMERARTRAESEFGISLYWIFDAVRHFGPGEAARVFRKAAELRPQFPSIIGIGIGGDERRAGAEPFRDLYAEARDAGLRLTAHMPGKPSARKESGAPSTLEPSAYRSRALGDPGSGN
jgi:aminodeoxyfutalosine deaminase